MKKVIDRHGPRLMPNNGKNLNPPNFSLPSTFNRGKNKTLYFKKVLYWKIRLIFLKLAANLFSSLSAFIRPFVVTRPIFQPEDITGSTKTLLPPSPPSACDNRIKSFLFFYYSGCIFCKYFVTLYNWANLKLHFYFSQSCHRWLFNGSIPVVDLVVCKKWLAIFLINFFTHCEVHLARKALHMANF